MVQLLESDIETKEVLNWEGIHLLHFQGSSCSQKTRIFLSLKGIDWISHPVDLARQENYSEWFLGINPRGLVPVLVHDGIVHIESNDILAYIEDRFPDPPLIPAGSEREMQALLKEEDDLHLDIRAITMRFIVPRRLAMRTPKSLETYQSAGSGSVGGMPDPQRGVELEFWRSYAEHGITDQRARQAVDRFRSVYETFEERLANDRYLFGGSLTLVDIAWFIYTSRLSTAGYPFADLHPRVLSWYAALLAREEFAREAIQVMPLKAVTAVLQFAQRIRGTTLREVAGG